MSVNELHGWTMSKKCPTDGLKGRKDKLRFFEKFIQNNDEEAPKWAT